MSNEQLQSNVADELRWDPRLDSAGISVTAQNGAVTLRGTVGSFLEKRAAKKATERVAGVTAVENELEVHLLTESRRVDADLRGDILRALALNANVPDTVDAEVDNGFVTLTGTAVWEYQRDAAKETAGNVRGVIEVWDRVELTGPGPDPGALGSQIRDAFTRRAVLDANGLTVATSPNGAVTLSGSVRSWSEHDEALAAAWAAPGVRDVQDRIVVDY
jgi:osmotically-inducible protein OsmY